MGWDVYDGDMVCVWVCVKVCRMCVDVVWVVCAVSVCECDVCGGGVVCVSPLHTYLCFTHLCAASLAWLRCSFQRRLPASLKHLEESGARAAHLGAHPLYTQQV